MCCSRRARFLPCWREHATPSIFSNRLSRRMAIIFLIKWSFNAISPTSSLFMFAIRSIIAGLSSGEAIVPTSSLFMFAISSSFRCAYSSRKSDSLGCLISKEFEHHNSNWKKLLGSRNMQEKLENDCCSFCLFSNFVRAL